VAWLDRYFFTEKLALQELAQSACVVVDGATASSFVDGAAALAPWGARRAGPLVAVRTFDVADGDGAVVPAFVLVSLDATTAPLPAASTSTEDFACAAIAAGVPTREIGDAHTPLDLALHDAIHWAKGCYIGQEVIARLDTYGKQKKHLTGVVVDAGAVVVGDVVVVDGSAVGALTSVAPRPWCASLPSALALVKGVDEGDGLAAHVKRSDGTLVDVRLVPRRAAQRPHD
jgi:folate-binding protein YgfZ